MAFCTFAGIFYQHHVIGMQNGQPVCLEVCKEKKKQKAKVILIQLWLYPRCSLRSKKIDIKSNFLAEKREIKNSVSVTELASGLEMAEHPSHQLLHRHGSVCQN